MSAICELPGGIITKNDTLFVFISDDAGLRIGELTAGRQCQLEEYAVTFERNDTAANNTASLLHRSPCCTIQSIPKLFDIGVCSTPAVNERLNFVISETTRLEFAPCS